MMVSLVHNKLLSGLVGSATIRHFAKNQIVVYPNDPDSKIYLLKTGAVTLETVTDEGDRKILYIFSAPTLFPMMAFTEKSVSSPWFYITLAECEMYVLSYDDLRSKMQETDGFTVYNSLLHQLLVEFHELLLHLSKDTKTDSKDKIISMLTFLFKHHTKQCSNR